MAKETPGSALYHLGENAMAVLLEGKAKVPASRFPCANCHGEDGMGGREGATEIPPIGWKSLSKPTVNRPAYSDKSFRKAILSGIAANGKELSELMPRYETDPQNLVSLIDYLTTLDVEQRTGIKTRAIQIAPPENKDERRGFMEAIERFNNQGGSYGRTIETEFKGQYFLAADNFASNIEEQLTQAIQNQILNNVVDDGISVVTLSSGDPAQALTHKLNLLGLEYDESAPTMLVLDTDPINLQEIDKWIGQSTQSSTLKSSSDITLRIYGSVSAVGPHVNKLTTNGNKLILVDFDEDSVRWALSEQFSARAAVGFALGTLLGEAILISGRDPTRHAVVKSMDVIDLQARLYTWNSSD